MKSLWTKVWSWYTGHTTVRHAVVVAISYTTVHYATFLTNCGLPPRGSGPATLLRSALGCFLGQRRR